MPAFDPVRDAVLNSPIESPSLPSRRATDLSVLLNDDPRPVLTAAEPIRRLAYNPKRITKPDSVLVPLSQDEIVNYTNNYRGQGVTRLTSKRKRASSNDSDERPSKKHTGDVGVVVEHYNSRPDVGVVQRQESPIIGLKAFNNWVKSVLITRFAHPALQKSRTRTANRHGKVLDMGCGKGGDISKWSKSRAAEVMFADIAAVSVDQARARWQGIKGPRFSASFAAIDCYTEHISKGFLPERLEEPFDVVSMQFCMHYAFETVQKARCMLENVTTYLRPGGIFIGTIPNSETLLYHLDRIPPNVNDKSFGNSVYRIMFDSNDDARPIYGHRYWFYLQDAVDNIPEYMVRWDNFVQLASEYKLRPIYKEEFHRVFTEHQHDPDFKQLLIKMNVVDAQGESAMDEDQWDAANIYIAFAFEKI